MKAAKLAYPMDEFYPSLTLPAPVAGPLQAGEPPAYISLHMSTHKLYSWSCLVFTYIFAAHWDRQVGQVRSRTDPQEKPAAELHDVKVYDLLQNLLRKIVHRNGFTHRPVLCSVHFV